MPRQAESSKNKVMLVKEALSKLSKQQYSIEELTSKPPPEGVDPLRLEDYLSDQDFKVGHSATLLLRQIWSLCIVWSLKWSKLDWILWKKNKLKRNRCSSLPVFRNFWRWVELSSTPCPTGSKKTWRKAKACFKTHKQFLCKLFIFPIIPPSKKKKRKNHVLILERIKKSKCTILFKMCIYLLVTTVLMCLWNILANHFVQGQSVFGGKMFCLYLSNSYSFFLHM